MNDFAILAPFFAVVCPAGMFLSIILFGDVYVGLSVFLVAFAVVLVYMDKHTSINMWGESGA